MNERQLRRFAVLRRLGPVFPVALLVILASGCSTDPTTTDEYQTLQQELATAEANLAAAEANLSGVEQELAGLPAAPPELGGLVDDWYAAREQGDVSVLDLYVAEGYHLYGDTRFEYDEIVGHLSGGSIEHEWITEPMLVAEDADGRYVVVRGMRNTSPIWSNASALLFEVVTTPDGELRFVQTAWFYDSEW
jgi:hypothetical protein